MKDVDRWGEGYLRGMYINWGFLSEGYSFGCNLRGGGVISGRPSLSN